MLDFRRLNLSKRKEFLDMADAAYKYLSPPVTDEEKAGFERFMRVFSSADEQFRCVDERNILHAKYQEQLDAAVAKRLNAEKNRLAEIERKQKLKEEAEQRLKAIEEKNRQTLIDEQKRIAELKQNCAQYGATIANAMLTAAITDDRTQLDEELRKTEEYMRLQLVQNAEEIKAFNALKLFIKDQEKELKALQLYKKRLAVINASHNIYVTIARKNVVQIEQIVPGAIYGRSTKSNKPRTILLHQLPTVSRASFCKEITRRFKVLNNPDFFISLFNRHVDKIALKDMPEKGFWKTYWLFFAKELEKK